MKKLYVPESEAELAVIRSLLDAERIDYFVHNDHFGSLEIGPRIDLYNVKTIMVAHDQYAWAVKVLGSFVETSRSPGRVYQPSFSTLDKIRMILEGFFFAWIMPGRRMRKRE